MVERATQNFSALEKHVEGYEAAIAELNRSSAYAVEGFPPLTLPSKYTQEQLDEFTPDDSEGIEEGDRLVFAICQRAAHELEERYRALKQLNLNLESGEDGEAQSYNAYMFLKGKPYQMLGNIALSLSNKYQNNPYASDLEDSVLTATVYIDEEFAAAQAGTSESEEPESEDTFDSEEMRRTLQQIIDRIDVGLGESEHTYRFWKDEVAGLPEVLQAKYEDIFADARHTLRDVLEETMQGTPREDEQPLTADDEEEWRGIMQKIIDRDDPILEENAVTVGSFAQHITAIPEERRAEFTKLLEQARQVLRDILEEEMGEK